MVRDTSDKCFRELLAEGKIGERQQMVYSYIKNYGPSTDWEITAGLGFVERNSVSPRRKELLDYGAIQDLGKVKCPISGRTSHYWGLSDD